jgi:hypothetical protein
MRLSPNHLHLKWPPLLPLPKVALNGSIYCLCYLSLCFFREISTTAINQMQHPIPEKLLKKIPSQTTAFSSLDQICIEALG